MKIAVFDSGEGCKYVAGELRKEFPQWKIVTYEDRDNFPYGGKTKRELNKKPPRVLFGSCPEPAEGLGFSEFCGTLEKTIN